jgi:hypothetical protein
MKKLALNLIFCMALGSCAVSQDFLVSKGGGSATTKQQTLVYALPQTAITVTVEAVKNTLKHGPYAEYAQKYLAIPNVPMEDSTWWELADASVNASQEADLTQLYTLTYSTFPENIRSLLSVSGKGVILDFAAGWNSFSEKKALSGSSPEVFFDPNLTDETQKEKVDTLYKTVMTDSSVIKVPVIKKKVLIKTVDDIAKETAKELLKTRKRKLKILRGEYDFHPDGNALKVMVAELEKQEEEYLQMFAGVKRKEKFHYTFTIIPDQSFQTKDLGYFSPRTGFNEAKGVQTSEVSLVLTKESDVKPTVLQTVPKNAIALRTPVMAKDSVVCNGQVIASKRLPIYQLGQVQTLPLK